MSDGEVALGAAWSVVVGLAWVFLVLRPRLVRLQQRYGARPPQAPMGEQLRLIAWIVLGAVVLTAILIALALWEPVVAFAGGPFLFYGYLTAVLAIVERHAERPSEST